MSEEQGAEAEGRAKAREVKKKAEYFGAGLGGLALFATAIATAFDANSATRILRAGFLTVAFLAGVCTSFAWATALSNLDGEPIAAEVNSAVGCMNKAVGLIFLSGVALVLTACIAATAGQQGVDPGAPAHPKSSPTPGPDRETDLPTIAVSEHDGRS